VGYILAALDSANEGEEYEHLKTGFWSGLHEHAFQYTRFYSSISKSTLIPEKQQLVFNEKRNYESTYNILKGTTTKIPNLSNQV
jgi:hypothetical protein